MWEVEGGGGGGRDPLGRSGGGGCVRAGSRGSVCSWEEVVCVCPGSAWSSWLCRGSALRVGGPPCLFFSSSRPWRGRRMVVSEAAGARAKRRPRGYA